MATRLHRACAMRATFRTSMLAGAALASLLSFLLAEAVMRLHAPPAGRLAIAILAAGAAVLALDRLWRRMMDAPMRRILERINVMRHGTWTAPPAASAGDFCELDTAINELGQDLTFTAHQFARASKLAALAMLENRFCRRLHLATEHLSSIVTLLTLARDYAQPVPETAIGNLQLAARDLREMQAQLMSEFDRRLRDQEEDGLEPEAARAGESAVP